MTIWQIQKEKQLMTYLIYNGQAMKITKEDLLNIFAKNNSYIVSTDDEKISKNLENNIMQIVRAVNTAFKISKTNFVWIKKIEENKKNMEAQLKGVSLRQYLALQRIQKKI